MTEEEAVVYLHGALSALRDAAHEVDERRKTFAQACIAAHEAGMSDQKIADLTKEWEFKYSRARIQQFRCGDPQKAVAV